MEAKMRANDFFSLPFFVVSVFFLLLLLLLMNGPNDEKYNLIFCFRSAGVQSSVWMHCTLDTSDARIR